MSFLRSFVARLVSPFRRERLERELDAELQAYVALDVEESVRRGMAPNEARRTALARLGGMEMVKELCRDVRRFRAADLGRDVRDGARSLARRPAFTAVAVLSLALGIGANTAIFSLVNAIILRNSPIERPEEVVNLYLHQAQGHPTLEMLRGLVP